MILKPLFLGTCFMVLFSSFILPSNHSNLLSLVQNDDYFLLKAGINNDAWFIEEELRFIYDEPYNDTELKYKIYANDGKVLYSNLDKAVNIRYGRNYIELKFDQLTFGNWASKNPLLLEVTNAKNNKQYLKFNYPK